MFNVCNARGRPCFILANLKYQPKLILRVFRLRVNRNSIIVFSKGIYVFLMHYKVANFSVSCIFNNKSNSCIFGNGGVIHFLMCTHFIVKRVIHVFFIAINRVFIESFIFSGFFIHFLHLRYIRLVHNLAHLLFCTKL